jgi:hypothetical protein
MQEKRDCTQQSLFVVHYAPKNFTSVAIMNIVAKKPNDTMKPTAESTASLRVH